MNQTTLGVSHLNEMQDEIHTPINFQFIGNSTPLEKIEAFWVATYELFPISPLNALATQLKARRGALLRIEFKNLGSGFADCHPWEEMGDINLEEQLQKLKNGLTTPLSSRSVEFAYLDAKARSKKINLIQSEKIPPSHYLITHLETLELQTWSELFNIIKHQGYRRLKIKISQPLIIQLNRLESVLNALEEFENFKVRLDFNAKADFEILFDWLKHLPRVKRKQIEFLEDPLPFNQVNWNALSAYVPLAEDFEEALPDSSVHSKVFKPAREEPSSLDKKVLNREQIVVTSSMDHPLGQLCAAYSAAELKKRFPEKIDVCGLLTHSLYQKNSFSEQLSIRNAQLQSVEGSGFGFDSLLFEQNWKRLK